MKRIVFTIASRRLEVDLEDDFADYVLNDLVEKNFSLEKGNEASQLLQLYLKTIHHEYKSEEQIKILLNNMESINK